MIMMNKNLMDGEVGLEMELKLKKKNYHLNKK